MHVRILSMSRYSYRVNMRVRCPKGPSGVLDVYRRYKTGNFSAENLEIRVNNTAHTLIGVYWVVPKDSFAL